MPSGSYRGGGPSETDESAFGYLGLPPSLSGGGHGVVGVIYLLDAGFGKVDELPVLLLGGNQLGVPIAKVHIWHGRKMLHSAKGLVQ